VFGGELPGLKRVNIVRRRRADGDGGERFALQLQGQDSPSA
jgi:hypothetical protein